jgi:hypothetical protein
VTTPHYLMYYCDDKHVPLERKILDAADRLHNTRGIATTEALVHPSALGEQDIAIDGIAVKAWQTGNVNMVWVRVEDAPATALEQLGLL